MPEPIVFQDNLDLLPFLTSVEHRFVDLDNNDKAIKTTAIISEHEFKVSTVSHPPHAKIHGAMVSNINELLESVETAIRDGLIRELYVPRAGSQRMQLVKVSFAAKDPADD